MVCCGRVLFVCANKNSVTLLLLFIVVIIMEAEVPSDSSPEKLKTTKKRKRHGRMSEVRKNLNLSSHTMGKDCQYTLKCFEKVPEPARNST